MTIEQLQSDYAALGARVSVLEANANWFSSAIQNQNCINHFAFESQAAIDERTAKVSRNLSGTNENVVFDLAKNAASIRVAHSLQLHNRVDLALSKITTGEVRIRWEYMPSAEWLGNDWLVSTHKMFMIGTTNRRDQRMLEIRFHYLATNPNMWRCDTRTYAVVNGPEVLPTNPQSLLFVGQWILFTCTIDLTGAVPTYTLNAKQGQTTQAIYDKFPLDRFFSNNLSLDFFSPTWANTSQDTHTNPPCVHGWLRNAVVEWNPSGKLNGEI